MNSTPVCQAVFHPDGEGGVTVRKARNCTVKRRGTGNYTIDFLGALGIDETDLDVSAWCHTLQNILLQRVVNVRWNNGFQFSLLITDAAGVVTDDFECGFYTSHVQGG